MGEVCTPPIGTSEGAFGGVMPNRLTISITLGPSSIAASVQGRLQDWASANSRVTFARLRHKGLGSAGQLDRRNGQVEKRSFRLKPASCTPISGNNFPVDPIERAMSVARFHSPV
jgi:hypothetical protein